MATAYIFNSDYWPESPTSLSPVTQSLRLGGDSRTANHIIHIIKNQIFILRTYLKFKIMFQLGRLLTLKK